MCSEKTLKDLAFWEIVGTQNVKSLFSYTQGQWETDQWFVENEQSVGLKSTNKVLKCQNPPSGETVDLTVTLEVSSNLFTSTIT